MPTQKKAPAAKKARAAKKPPAAKKAPSAKKAAPAAKKAAAPTPGLRTPPKVGELAPDFALPADDGSTVRLADLRGKTVVLYFYPKDDTPGCTKEACGFRDAERAYAQRGVAVFGVSKDSVASHQKFVAKYKLPFRLLSDPGLETIAAYGSYGPKKFMGRESMGTLRTTVVIGPDGRVLKVFPKVATETHAADVLSALG